MDDAVYAWTEPVFHVWSAVLPLLLVPPGWHVLFHRHEANAEHSHTWLWVFAATWLVCWIAAVPYACHVAYRGRPAERYVCGTRGEALRLAAAVRRKIGAPG